MLAALLGGIVGRRQPVADDGGIRIGQAHPWFIQLCTDLAALEDLDSLSTTVNAYTLPDGRLNIRDLVLEASDELRTCDAHELKRIYLAVAIPPPGSPQPDQEAYDDLHPQGQHVCHLRQADGDECGLAFRTLRGLRVHQRLAQGGQHGSRCY